MQIKCENCQTLQPVDESYHHENGDVAAKCKSGCGMSFEVVSAETLREARKNNYPTVAGIIASGWQRKQMMQDRHEKVVADLETSEGATASPEPKSAPQADAAPQEPSTPPEPSPANDAVYEDAKKRAAAAGMPVDENEEPNPVLKDAMRRARQ